jgi:CPA1 family monovalent cation:H+ antiporter
LQALALAAVLVGLRVLWVWPMSAVVEPVRGAASWRVAAVVTWAGTRGVMPLAAALSIPLVADDGNTLPGRPLVLVLTTAVVVFTLVVQGLSLAPLVNRSGIALEPEDTAREQDRTREHLARTGLEHLDRLADLGAAPEAALARARLPLEARLEQSRARDQDLDRGDRDRTPEEDSVLHVYRQLRREVIALQSAELRQLYDGHRISDTTRRLLQYDLDLEETGLGRHTPR